MYRTHEIELNNGKRDDHSETLIITITHGTNCWTYHIALETNGSSFDIAESGDNAQIAEEEAMWWYDNIRIAIEDMIRNQTAVGIDVDNYLADEGAWMVDFDPETFDIEHWTTDYTN